MRIASVIQEMMKLSVFRAQHQTKTVALMFWAGGNRFLNGSSQLRLLQWLWRQYGRLLPHQKAHFSTAGFLIQDHRSALSDKIIRSCMQFHSWRIFLNRANVSITLLERNRVCVALHVCIGTLSRLNGQRRLRRSKGLPVKARASVSFMVTDTRSRS